MSKKCYMIDFENTGPMWYDATKKAGSEDIIILFYSRNCQQVNLDSLSDTYKRGCELRFIKCNVGKNGLDFQLASELGYLAAVGSIEEIYIVSNDTGYDVLKEYWSRRNITVKRLPVNNFGSSKLSSSGFNDVVPWPTVNSEDMKLLLAEEATPEATSEPHVDAEIFVPSVPSAPKTKQTKSNTDAAVNSQVQAWSKEFKTYKFSQNEQLWFAKMLVMAAKKPQKERLNMVYQNLIRVLGDGRGRRIYKATKPRLKSVLHC